MADKTGIEWTDATWNPVAGCAIVSPGCTNCYAMKMAARIEAMQPNSHYAGLTKKVNGNAVWTGRFATAPDSIISQPLRWKRPRRIFVNSMSDLFGEGVTDETIDKVFAIMALSPQHIFQVLTKRPERMREYIGGPETVFRVAKEVDALATLKEQEPEDVRPITGFPGYFASSHGFIYSEKRGPRRRMKPDIGEQGHMRVQLHRDGQDDQRGERLLVHRLILETFTGPAPADDAQGRHRDGNPRHNAITNLSWGDQSDNWLDSKRHGSHRRYSKMSQAKADEIRRRHACGETGEALAREFNISATQIRNIASGAQWAVRPSINWPLHGVWLGVSVEDQKRADERIPHLLSTPATVRFVSAEPLLGPISFCKVDRHKDGGSMIQTDALTGITRWKDWEGCGHPLKGGDTPSKLDWVIVGGESGPCARPMNPQWARSIRDQCKDAGTAFFMKQMSGVGDKAIKDIAKFAHDLQIRQFPVGGASW